MTIITHNVAGNRIAEIQSESVLINSASDGAELLGNIYYQDFDRMILQQKHISPAFFDLKNGLAGDVLQKFSNYRMRLAIVGDFDKYSSKSVRDFIFESNNQGNINFVKSLEEALKILK